MKFYASPDGKAKLMVQETPQSNGEVLIIGRFRQRENTRLANRFLAQVATKLADMVPGSDEMADLLESAEQQISRAKTAENFLETPKFEV